MNVIVMLMEQKVFLDSCIDKFKKYYNVHISLSLSLSLNLPINKIIFHNLIIFMINTIIKIAFYFSSRVIDEKKILNISIKHKSAIYFSYFRIM